VGRFGGDEFLVVLPDCDGGAAVTIAERLRALVAGAPIRTSAGDIRQRASFGVAAAVGPGHAGAYDLVLAADAALFEAKRGGRDRVEVAVVGDVRPDEAGPAACSTLA
jgi:diguanylate cyclase (GGDEF)-like protein